MLKPRKIISSTKNTKATKEICMLRYLQKAFYMVRQAHHERKKVNKFNTTTVRPELVEGQLPGILQVPLLC
jgi:hypothetical protein